MFSSHRAHLAALVTTTIVVTVVLCSVGWLLLRQQAEIDEQRAHAEIAGHADTVAAGIRTRLAETGDRVSAWVSNPATAAPIDGAVVVTSDANGFRVVPAGALPFVPAVVPDGVSAAFTAAETTEFRGGRVDAAARYRALTGHHDKRIQAGAWFRLSRALRNSGDYAKALLASESLRNLSAVRVGDVPAELAGLVGARSALRGLNRPDDAARLAAEIRDGLDNGRWAVARGDAEAYREETGAGGHVTDRGDPWRLAAAISDIWNNTTSRIGARGHQIVVVDGRPAIVLWRASTDRTAVLAEFADSLLAAAIPIDGSWRLVDAEGQVVVGVKAAPATPVERVVNAEYPWRVEVWGSATARPSSPGSRAALLFMLATTAVFTWATTYFMARAIRREAETARLQSDFVAAVSHEFRSPLTTIRQLAESLEMDRIPNEERRSLYYRTVGAEAARLQRLVETLLNFGRMEAGAERYRLVDLETASLVRGVVEDVEPQARSAGLRIETTGQESGVVVRADENALTLAIRNLLDNAIKYSPGRAPIRIEWGVDRDRVAIHVSDSGVGIPADEQKKIFNKFVRGTAAISTNVKGTGVGLSMVRQIVLGHGGEIQLRSQVGRGSTFTLLLPAASGAAQNRVMA